MWALRSVELALGKYEIGPRDVCYAPLIVLLSPSRVGAGLTVSVHPMSPPPSHVAPNRKAREQRLEAFETLELACVGYRDWRCKWESMPRVPIELV